ncbi:hypothetical protein RDWZM_007989 [Blomia tropicalis]|uniref:Nicotinate-nucleotide pyrophosphorylase [carboxylating] n=1 Tax=Blomia tropicalis TaxID=40697 RepID=A0A9Q0M0X3_BLOTA|nr:hypothetical protein RDWZM_007989 [Blomia tropicalis]
MVGSNFVKAQIFAKEQGILAGVPFVDAICEEVGIKKPTWIFQEGAYLLNASPTNRTSVAVVVGPAKKVLLAERIMLNVLCRCSGVATESHRVRSALAWNGWSGQVVGTRKTTPGFRMVEKYGLLVGGAGTHRYDMSSMVMLKDNHVKLSGQTSSMHDLITKTKKYAGFQFKIEVECQNLDDALNAAHAGADIVMLDNLEPEEAIAAAKELKSAHPNLLIEASGGINSSNAAKYAVPEIDIISMSCLVQGYPIIDFSMKVD